MMNVTGPVKYLLKLTLDPGALLASLVNLDRSLGCVLDTLPDKVEAMPDGHSSLFYTGMDSIVDSFEEMSDLLDAQRGVGVEDKRNDGLTRGGCDRRRGVVRIVEAVSTTIASEADTVGSGLALGFATVRTGHLVPRLVAALPETEFERVGGRHIEVSLGCRSILPNVNCISVFYHIWQNAVSLTELFRSVRRELGKNIKSWYRIT